MRNIKFIGELTKFKVCPPKVALLCLRNLLHTFRHHNIDVACNLLETCGRFLYRTGDTHVRIKLLLEEMMKKRAILHLDDHHAAMVNNAFYYCNPPEFQGLQRKVGCFVATFAWYFQPLCEQ